MLIAHTHTERQLKTHRPGEVKSRPSGYVLTNTVLFFFSIPFWEKKKESQQFHIPENNTGRVSEHLTKPRDF